MMTTPATTPPDGELTLDASEVQFLAARLRRLFAHFKYKLPHWAHTDDKHLIGIAPTCIGAVLANLNADRATLSPGKAQEPVAWRWIPSKVWRDHVVTDDKEKMQAAISYGITVEPLYASPGKAEAERWIPVTESSPMQGEAVLVAVEFDGPGDWRIKCGGLTEERTWKVFGASWTPSHWMPLPPPPGAIQQERDKQ